MLFNRFSNPQHIYDPQQVLKTNHVVAVNGHDIRIIGFSLYINYISFFAVVNDKSVTGLGLYLKTALEVKARRLLKCTCAVTKRISGGTFSNTDIKLDGAQKNADRHLCHCSICEIARRWTWEG